MVLKKIRDLEPEERCSHPEHEPPKNICLSPGVYEHTCPNCGGVIYFTVPLVTWSTPNLVGDLNETR